LAAAVRARRDKKTQIVYDSHELWPYADLISSPWEQRLVAAAERHLVRRVTSVITISPMLADLLADMYGLDDIKVVPNAAPIEEIIEQPPDSPPTPLKFLLQGNAAAARGFEQLLEGWEAVDPDLAVLYLRCPRSKYFSELQARFSHLLRSGRVVALDAVSPESLISAASFADIGVIPYVGPSPNHLFCCPNKLSQYMQAGLAIFSNDLAYVRQIVDKYDIGMTYQAERPTSVAEAVHLLGANPARVGQMRQAARQASLTSFNWREVARPYSDAVRDALAASDVDG
jgi:glycosyltransferase involved in cell wall biosynthesis